jgi:uncharacterized protein (DUF2252 family)
MAKSAYAYLRGSAASMAADVATGPLRGICVQASGDCHLNNFGFFASPERRLLFDITDFDETAFAGWEFDLKRLVVSVVPKGRELGCGKPRQRALAMEATRAYVEGIHNAAKKAPVEAWYTAYDEDAFIREAPPRSGVAARRIDFIDEMRRKTGSSMIEKLVVGDGRRMRFKAKKGKIEPLHAADPLREEFQAVLERYPRSLAPDRQLLFSRYELVDIALKVVGVGSIGSRCGIALYRTTAGEPLVLQVKEAKRSVLERFTEAEAMPSRAAFDERVGAHAGRRVVQGQRLMQAASDMFLGWASGLEERQYYVRQLSDMKESLPEEEWTKHRITNIASLCGKVLARAHAKVTDVAELAGYLGDGMTISEAMARFAKAYADQVTRDFELFRAGENSGRLPMPAPGPKEV